MNIKVEIIKDSINFSNKRLTTFVLTFPRFILAEFNTHRMFSRNTASSRAISIPKMLKMVKDQPFVPKSFNYNAKGMQGGLSLSIEQQKEAEVIWLKGRDEAILTTEKLLKLNISKQYVNRLLEPYSFTTVICTATEYQNFFNLRDHKDAQPEIQELAHEMKIQYNNNIPKQLDTNMWHLPFVDKQEEGSIIRSVARCARVSYLNHDGKETSLEQDEDLFNKLKEAGHFSPFEHIAQSLPTNTRCNNFIGWKQYRRILEKE